MEIIKATKNLTYFSPNPQMWEMLKIIPYVGSYIIREIN